MTPERRRELLRRVLVGPDEEELSVDIVSNPDLLDQAIARCEAELAGVQARIAVHVAEHGAEIDAVIANAAEVEKDVERLTAIVREGEHKLLHPRDGMMAQMQSLEQEFRQSIARREVIAVQRRVVAVLADVWDNALKYDAAFGAGDLVGAAGDVADLVELLRRLLEALPDKEHHVASIVKEELASRRRACGARLDELLDSLARCDGDALCLGGRAELEAAWRACGGLGEAEARVGTLARSIADRLLLPALARRPCPAAVVQESEHGATLSFSPGEARGDAVEAALRLAEEALGFLSKALLGGRRELAAAFGAAAWARLRAEGLEPAVLAALGGLAGDRPALAAALERLPPRAAALEARAKQLGPRPLGPRPSPDVPRRIRAGGGGGRSRVLRGGRRRAPRDRDPPHAGGRGPRADAGRRLGARAPPHRRRRGAGTAAGGGRHAGGAAAAAAGPARGPRRAGGGAAGGRPAGALRRPPLQGLPPGRAPRGDARGRLRAGRRVDPRRGGGAGGGRAGRARPLAGRRARPPRAGARLRAHARLPLLLRLLVPRAPLPHPRLPRPPPAAGWGAGGGPPAGPRAAAAGGRRRRARQVPGAGGGAARGGGAAGGGGPRGRRPRAPPRRHRRRPPRGPAALPPAGQARLGGAAGGPPRRRPGRRGLGPPRRPLPRAAGAGGHLGGRVAGAGRPPGRPARGPAGRLVPARGPLAGGGGGPAPLRGAARRARDAPRRHPRRLLRRPPGGLRAGGRRVGRAGPLRGAQGARGARPRAGGAGAPPRPAAQALS